LEFLLRDDARARVALPRRRGVDARAGAVVPGRHLASSALAIFNY
jgi:hypothetical protein